MVSVQTDLQVPCNAETAEVKSGPGNFTDSQIKVVVHRQNSRSEESTAQWVKWSTQEAWLD